MANFGHLCQMAMRVAGDEGKGGKAMMSRQAVSDCNKEGNGDEDNRDRRGRGEYQGWKELWRWQGRQ
jgi:hypothetical protein